MVGEITESSVNGGEITGSQQLLMVGEITDSSVNGGEITENSVNGGRNNREQC